MNIVGNLLTEFNQEDYDRNRRAEGFEDGRALGRSEGERQNAIANAKNFLRKSNLSAEMIADCCSLPLEQVLALKKELEQQP